ncbi:MAG: hypothetical protein K8R69_00065, partial [Deltaproteobacteria bacterium]|nr:hypothetical protein [Deltaproteobacteria bacterium]
VLSACDGAPGAPSESATPPTAANFNYISLGDSLAAGVQDGTTNEHTQPHSYAALLAKQIAKTYGTFLTMPLLGVDGTRENPDKIPTLLGISGEDSASIYQTKAGGDPLGPDSGLHDKTLAPIAFAAGRGEASSQLDAALWLAEKWKGAPEGTPKILTLWLNNDVLGAVVQIGDENYTAEGINAAMTAPDIFRGNMDFVLQALSRTGAQVFLGNIPDITQIAYLVSGETLSRWTGQSIPATLLPAGARMSLPAALRIYTDFLAGRDWQDSLAEHLNDASVMSPEEMALVHARILELNAILQDLAGKYSSHLVDLYQSLRTPQTISGITFTNEWGAGGFFCLDGVHFSHSGHAYVANLFLRAINQAIATSIPEIDVAEVRINDPYVDADHDGFPAGPTYESPLAIVQLLFQFRDADDHDAQVGIRGTPETIHELKSLALPR